MDHPLLTDIARLLDTYRTLQDRRYEALSVGFERLKAGLKELQQRAAVGNVKHASRFNVFEIFQVQNYEVNTHSRLLCDLLSPEGTHAQGTLFLETFLKRIANNNESFSEPVNHLVSSQWQVEREKQTGFGNLDLVIASQATGCLVVIENKIWAQEQDDQLNRYYRWMEHRRASHPNQALIYLTRGGWGSNTARQASYMPMSYRYDIAGWLEGCLPKIQAKRVVETLRQYLDVIRRF